MKAATVFLLTVHLALSPLAQESAAPALEWKAFRSALNLLNDREFERALPELERFKNSPVPAIAARANVEIATIYMDVKRDMERAIPYLTEVTQNSKYLPLASLWASAVYRAGQIKLGKAGTREQVLDVQSDFDRIYQTYPDTSLSAEALFTSALLSEQLQDYDSAIEKYQRLRKEYNNSRSTPQALFNLARHYAFKGEYQTALLQFQEIRNLFPDTSHSKLALAALTGLYRFYRRTLAPNSSLYGTPQEVSISDIKELIEPHSLLITDNDELFLVDRGKKYAFKFRTDGRVVQTLPVSDPMALALGPDGALYAAERDTIRQLQVKDAPLWRPMITGPKGDRRALRRINSLAVGNMGDLYAIDSESSGVIKYSTIKKDGALFPPQQNLRNVRQVTVDGLGNVYLLDEKENKILVYNALGVSLGQIRVPNPGGASRSGAVALTTDALNHLYVLDRGGSFYVYELTYKSPRSVDAKLITQASFSGKFKDSPQTLAVSRSGRVFITAKKSSAVLAFR